MKAKLLYFHAGKSSFVIKDIEILQEQYIVVDFFFDTSNKKQYLMLFIKQKLFLLKHIFGAKLIVCQFAGHHSFLPILFSKIFFKKSIVVAGGTDCVSFPSIGYGNFSNKLLGLTTAFSFKSCHLILPVHQTLVEYDYTYQPNDFKKQGLPEKNLDTWLKESGWEAVLNRKGTSWRKLSPEEQLSVINEATARPFLMANPSLVKRPVIEWQSSKGMEISVGFQPNEWPLR